MLSSCVKEEKLFSLYLTYKELRLLIPDPALINFLIELYLTYKELRLRIISFLAFVIMYVIPYL